MYGLTDRMVAESDPGRFVPGHSKVNREYIVTREPDLVITHLDLELNTPVFLKRENYLRRGYKLAYMLYLGAENPEHGSLIDVRGLAPKLKERWCIRGYTYGILSKVDLDLPDAYPAAQYSRS